MSKCKHNRLKRRLIDDGKGVGTYTGYCTQQCKNVTSVTITEADIREVYPMGKPVERRGMK